MLTPIWQLVKGNEQIGCINKYDFGVMGVSCFVPASLHVALNKMHSGIMKTRWRKFNFANG
jgi:hypothetical protein